MKFDDRHPRLAVRVLAVVVALSFGVGCSPPPGSVDVDDDLSGDLSSWSSNIPSSWPLAPDPGTGVNSFSYAVVQQVSHTSHATAKVGCPAGFYVRPGSGDIWGDDTPEPVVKTFVGNTVLMQPTAGPDLQYVYSGTEGNVAVYQGMEEGYWNASAGSTHHFTFTFWCDRLANLNLSAPAQARRTKPSTSAAGQASPAPKSSPTSVGDNSAFNSPLQNLGTGQYLNGGQVGDTAQMSGSPSTLYVAGGPNGDPNDFYNAFAYGLWTEVSGILDGPNLGFDGDTATWFGPTSGIASGGLLLPVSGNVPGGAQMLVQANSIVVPDKGNVNDKTVGPGGQCLADPGGGAPTLQDCDATDPNQYWSFTG